jgi:hypothetical protein
MHGLQRAEVSMDIREDGDAHAELLLRGR